MLTYMQRLTSLRGSFDSAILDRNEPAFKKIAVPILGPKKAEFCKQIVEFSKKKVEFFFKKMSFFVK